MKKIKLALLSVMIAANSLAAPGDKDFNTYKEAFVLRFWKVYPGMASGVGYHKYDAVLVVPDEKSRTAELAFCNTELAALKKFKLTDLSDANKTDYHLIENQLNGVVWAIKKLKSYEWNPAEYNVGEVFANMLGNDYEPLDKRLHNFSQRMLAVPDYYKAARANIKNPTKEHTLLAIEQNAGSMSVFQDDLTAALNKSQLSETEKTEIRKRAKKCEVAIANYVEWLKNIKNDNPRSFRLGKELYAEKFVYDLQSGFTADEIYNKAVARKQELHDKMYDLTKKMWVKYFGLVKKVPENKLVAIKTMIDELSRNHVKKDRFQSAIEHQLPELTAFIKAKNLLYLDSTKPLVVRPEPAYMAGVAGASVNSPGPYDKGGNTYYNVGSLSGWDSAKAESYLREYNHYILPILNIHEAIPGHYTQLVYANQSPSIIKAIFGNNAMIEGWAVYTELMMLENGYDVDKDETSKQASPEMWLMYYKWNLRSTCNTILDYSVHTGNMTKEEAMDLLVNQAFQQKTEAEGKWRRVSVTQVQLCCYFTGFTEICDLRQALMNKQASSFNLKQFHETFLSFGSAPVKYIRQAMLK